MENEINTLAEDLATNSDWQNTYNTFLQTFASQLSNYLGTVNADANTQNFWNQYIIGENGNYCVMLSGDLMSRVYAYDTQTLLTLWTSLVYKLSLEFFLKINTEMFSYMNQFNIINSSNYANYNTYGLTSASQMQANITNSTSTNDTTGSITFSQITQNSNGMLYPNGTSINNNPAANVEIPLNDIDNSQQNTTDSHYNGIEVLRMINDLQNKVGDLVSRAIEEVFKKFFAPFYSLLPPKKGVGF